MEEMRTGSLSKQASKQAGRYFTAQDSGNNSSGISTYKFDAYGASGVIPADGLSV